jgi:hypothetical protein
MLSDVVSETASALVTALVTSACPSCAAGRQARALVLADGFWLHLAAAAAPIVVIAILGWLVDAHFRRVDARED